MEEKYIRVATTYYKFVKRPLHSGDFIEVRVPWNYHTLKLDYGKDFVFQIERYDGFCCVPSHVNYKRTIGAFLNEYEPTPVEPSRGECFKTVRFLKHIFGPQIELGLDYLQLLYIQPLQRLPILLLVSKERNTGKTTFLNLLKAIFGANMTFNTNEDFRSQFNSDWANKLIVAVDEVLLDRKDDSERIKNLSTAKSYKAEAKGKDRNEVEFFAKFVLCSNNELNPIHIERGENRYWVIKVPILNADNPNLFDEMKKELPALIWMLLHRELSTDKESRMWFKHSLFATDALSKIMNHSMNKTENEILHVFSEIMNCMKLEQLFFCAVDIVKMLEIRGIRIDHASARKIIQENWGLDSTESPQYHKSYLLLLDGSVESIKKTGRFFTLTKEKLKELL